MKELLSRGKNLKLTLSSGSMWPLLPRGAPVVVAPAKLPIRIGDIVVYISGAHLICHRVVRIKGRESNSRRYFTKGDSSQIIDPPHREEEILGLVVATRGGGRWQDLRTLDKRASSYFIGLLSPYSEPLRRIQRRLGRFRGIISPHHRQQ